MEQLEIRQVLAAAEFVLADSPTDLQLSFSNSGSGDEILLSDGGSLLRSYSVADGGPFDQVKISLADLSSATSFELGVNADDGFDFNGAAAFPITLTGSKFDDALTPKTIALSGSTIPEITFDGGQGDDSILGNALDQTWFITGNNAGTVSPITFQNLEVLNGGTGVNTLDYSLITNGVTVDLDKDDLGFNLTGTGFDRVIGTGFDDIVVGTSSDEVFRLSAGNDQATGGPGDDTYVFTDSWGIDTITESTDRAASPGEDTLDFSEVDPSTAITILISDDSIVATAGSHTVTTTRSIERLIGNTNTTLDYSGITFSDTTVGVYVDLSLQFGTGFTFLDGIANLIGTANDDTLIGNDLANDINAAAGNDIVDGGLGQDNLVAGPGADTFSVRRNIASMQITDSFFIADAVNEDTLSGFESAKMRGGADANQIDASQFFGINLEMPVDILGAQFLDWELDRGIGDGDTATPDIQITLSSGAVATVDLTSATTLQSAIDLITAAHASLTAQLIDGAIQITDSSGGSNDLTVENVGSSDAAVFLGLVPAGSSTNSGSGNILRGSALVGSGVSLYGGSFVDDRFETTLFSELNGDAGVRLVTPNLSLLQSPSIQLSALNNGSGVPFNSGDDISITLRDGTVAPFDFGSATTIQEVIDILNAHPNITVTIDPNLGSGLMVIDEYPEGTTLVNDSFTIAEVDGGTTADALGIRGSSSNGNAFLGSAITQPVPELVPDIRITVNSGRQFDVSLKHKQNIHKMITELNGLGFTFFEFAIASDGQSLVVRDLTYEGGANTFSIQNLNGSYAATDLGLSAASNLESTGLGNQEAVIRGTAIVSGDRTLDGRLDADNFVGSPGSDRIYSGGGANSINGGLSSDAIYVSNDAHSTVLTPTQLNITTSSGDATVSSSINSIEAAFMVGGESNNIIDASAFPFAVQIDGKAGEDQITGSEFGDVLSGGLGADVINGLGGLDTLEERADTKFILTSNSLDMGDGANQVYQLSLPSADAFSFFYLQVDDYSLGSETFIGKRTAPISYSTSASELQSELLGLSSIPANSVLVSTSESSTASAPVFDIEFTQSLAGMPINLSATYRPGNPSPAGALSAFRSATSNLDTLTSIEAATFLGGPSGNFVDASGFVVADPDGTPGNVFIEGGDGPDTIVGSPGDDVLFGQGGNDLISGGDGVDQVFGDAGIDRLLVRANSQDVTLTNDTLTDGTTVNQISGFENATLHGTALADTIDASTFTGVDGSTDPNSFLVNTAEPGSTPEFSIGVRHAEAPAVTLLGAESTPLSAVYPLGLGDNSTHGAADISITLRDGTVVGIDLTGANSFADLMNRVTLAHANLQMTLNPVGNALVVADSSAGSGTLTIDNAVNSTAASVLGLTASSSAGTIEGTAFPSTTDNVDFEITLPSGVKVPIDLQGVRTFDEIAEVITAANDSLTARFNSITSSFEIDFTVVSGQTSDDILIAPTETTRDLGFTDRSTAAGIHSGTFTNLSGTIRYAGTPLVAAEVDIYGYDGDDILTGSPGDDQFDGGLGSDNINGSSGPRDTLIGMGGAGVNLKLANGSLQFNRAGGVTETDLFTGIAGVFLINEDDSPSGSENVIDAMSYSNGPVIIQTNGGDVICGTAQIGDNADTLVISPSPSGTASPTQIYSSVGGEVDFVVIDSAPYTQLLSAPAACQSNGSSGAEGEAISAGSGTLTYVDSSGIIAISSDLNRPTENVVLGVDPAGSSQSFFSPINIDNLFSSRVEVTSDITAKSIRILAKEIVIGSDSSVAPSNPITLSATQGSIEVHAIDHKTFGSQSAGAGFVDKDDRNAKITVHNANILAEQDIQFSAATSNTFVLDQNLSRALEFVESQGSGDFDRPTEGDISASTAALFKEFYSSRFSFLFATKHLTSEAGISFASDVYINAGNEFAAETAATVVADVKNRVFNTFVDIAAAFITTSSTVDFNGTLITNGDAAFNASTAVINKVEAEGKGILGVGLATGISEINTTTRVNVGEQAVLQINGDLEMLASTFEVNSTYTKANAGDDGKAALTFTFSREDNETVASLLGDAFVGGSVDVQAEANKPDQNTQVDWEKLLKKNAFSIHKQASKFAKFGKYGENLANSKFFKVEIETEPTSVGASTRVSSGETLDTQDAKEKEAKDDWLKFKKQPWNPLTWLDGPKGGLKSLTADLTKKLEKKWEQFAKRRLPKSFDFTYTPPKNIFDVGVAGVIHIDENTVNATIGRPDSDGDLVTVVDALGDIQVKSKLLSRPSLFGSSRAINRIKGETYLDVEQEDSRSSSGKVLMSNPVAEYGASGSVVFGQYTNDSDAKITSNTRINAWGNIEVNSEVRDERDPDTIWGRNLAAVFDTTPKYRAKITRDTGFDVLQVEVKEASSDLVLLSNTSRLQLLSNSATNGTGTDISPGSTLTVVTASGTEFEYEFVRRGNSASTGRTPIIVRDSNDQKLPTASVASALAAELNAIADVTASATDAANPNLITLLSAAGLSVAFPSGVALFSGGLSEVNLQNGDVISVSDSFQSRDPETKELKWIGGEQLVDLATTNFTNGSLWSEEDSLSEQLGTIGGYLRSNLGLDKYLFNSWSQAVAQEQKKNVAGAVTILQKNHSSQATIQSGARINQGDVDYDAASKRIVPQQTMRIGDSHPTHGGRLVRYIGSVELTTWNDSTNFGSADWSEVTAPSPITINHESPSANINPGDVIRVRSNLTGKGRVNQPYLYLGAASTNTNLAGQDFTDTANWQPIVDRTVEVGQTAYHGDFASGGDNVYQFRNASRTSGTIVPNAASIAGSADWVLIEKGEGDVNVVASNVNNGLYLSGNFTLPEFSVFAEDAEDFAGLQRCTDLVKKIRPSCDTQNQRNLLGTDAETLAIGASVLVATGENNTVAEIGSGARVAGENVNVTADNQQQQILVGASGGAGGEFAANGAFSVFSFTDNTHALVHDQAIIEAAGQVVLSATDQSEAVSVAGAIARSEKVGVGASLAVNLLTRNTIASAGYLAPEDAYASDALVRAKGLNVNAENSGYVTSAAAAGAVVYESPLPSDDGSPDVASLPTQDSNEQGSSRNGFFDGFTAAVAAGLNQVNDLSESELRYLQLKLPEAHVATGSDIGNVLIVAKNTTKFFSFALGSSTAVGDFNGLRLAGAAAVNLVEKEIHATVENATVTYFNGGTGETTFEVKAVDESLLVAAAGSLALSLTSDNGTPDEPVNSSRRSGSVGVSVAVNQHTGDGKKVIANISNSRLALGNQYAVKVQAEDKEEVYGVAVGGAVATNSALQPLSTSSNNLVGSLSGGITISTLSSLVEASVDQLSNDWSIGSLDVKAEQTAKLLTFAFGVSVAYSHLLAGKGVSLAGSLGVGLTLNNVKNRVNAKVDERNQARKILARGTVNVIADSDYEIFALGVGVSGSKSRGSGTNVAFGLAGSGASNTLDSDVTAVIDGQQQGYLTILATESPATMSDGVTVTATDSSDIKSVSGALALAFGSSQFGSSASGALGAAISKNVLGKSNDSATPEVDERNEVLAKIIGLTTHAQFVEVKAENAQSVYALAMGGAGAGAKAGGIAVAMAGAGAGAENIRHQRVLATVEKSPINTTNHFFVESNDQSVIAADAGGVAATLAFVNENASAPSISVSVGAATAENKIYTDIESGLKDSNVSVGSLAVDARAINSPNEANEDKISAFAFGVAGAGNYATSNGLGLTLAGAGSAARNDVDQRVNASVKDTSETHLYPITIVSNSDSLVSITSEDSSTLTADSGGFAVALALSKTGSSGAQIGGAIGASVAENKYGGKLSDDGTASETKAILEGAAISFTNSEGTPKPVIITADSSGSLSANAMGAAGNASLSGSTANFLNLSLAGAGSGSHNDLATTVAAEITNAAKLGASDHEVGQLPSSVEVSAIDGWKAHADSGGVAVAFLGSLGSDNSMATLSGSIGAAISENTLSNNVRAKASGSSTEIHTSGPLTIAADSRLGASNREITISAIDSSHQITVTNHQFVDGQTVVYQSNGQAPLDGLTNQAHYVVEVIDDDTIRLKDTNGALVALPSNATPGANHEIMGNARQIPIVTAPVANRFEIDNHSLQTGDQVIYR
ncbi:MAG: hypothetical protein VYA84_00005, partial [Planctomycetota bacterium]|nr:hypothetical protein [Planctomycetota bacterium]